MTKQEFQNLVKQDIVILDGATGSNLMKAGMPRGVCTEQWICDNPEAITRLQKPIKRQGLRLFMPLPFGQCHKPAKSRSGKHVRDLNLRLVDISRQAVGDSCLIAGDLTTTGKQELPYEELLGAYREQIEALMEAGADLLVAETMLGVTEPMAVLDAAAGELPVMCTLTVESDGSLVFGGNIYEAVETLEEMGAAAVGINCSTGPDQLFRGRKYEKKSADSIDCETQCRYAGDR